ncbi:DUF2847 family protein [Allocoprobacillus halotolerans]|uniref:DUF2847 family protein n=1 Tax=Allocoprobacillus halotolerans TaxID=2944914 RepID=A0ABY5HZJ9_9FIRM|nr:monothiol bacilliredoxin BrxC family protein [Allocoprobacillus halotolerans]UTY38454.1 DUF2847 family protein [Allocoprobacillus halotolerans]
MNFIKKFAKEISVFGLVLLIFLGLFIYRQATFKDYKTISQSQLTQMVEDQEDFVVVLGDSTNSTMTSYQEVMTKYTTKNRSTPFYYLDTSEIEDIDSYVEKTFDTNVTYPITFIIKDGKVTAKKEGYSQYYSLYDFIKENFK